MKTAELAVHQFEHALLQLLVLGGPTELAMLKRLRADILSDWDEEHITDAELATTALIDALEIRSPVITPARPECSNVRQRSVVGPQHPPSQEETIVAVEFVPTQYSEIDVYAKLTDGTDDVAFTFWPDELSFDESELIGLTLPEALALKYKKDAEYLRS